MCAFRFLFRLQSTKLMGMALVERYSNPPLALVVCEVRHPGRRLTPEQVEALRGRLQEHAPIARHDSMLEFSPATGEQRQVERSRFVSRNRLLTINMLHDRFSIETTSYQTWSHLRQVIQTAVEALSEISPPSGIDRIGLRYIDEIRVPSTTPPEWSDWVTESLLGPGRVLTDTGMRQTAQQGLAILTEHEARDSLTIRYGAMDGIPAVQSSDFLVRPEQPGPGPYFLLDFDAAWEADPTGLFPEFRATEILTIADRLHAPIRAVFEALVSDRLRQEVLR